MMENRRFCLHEVRSSEELARALTEETWPDCTAFQLGQCLFLNAQDRDRGEYIVARQRNGLLFLINSVAFAHCRFDEALRIIQDDLKDRTGTGRPVSFTLEPPDHHGWCSYCKEQYGR